MTENSIYQDIATRTNGAILIGVVGPVRTGKSTFIKKFMESIIIPHISNVYVKERAIDELPQSGSGRAIMTSEPKFVPEEPVELTLDDGVAIKIRLIDCVGYMIPGASGLFDNGEERLVTTPWYDYEISMTKAAEEGTKKVIEDHSTIGIVITTDGTICDISRENYLEAEEKVIHELKAIGKPFVLVLNSIHPKLEETQKLADELEAKYGVTVVVVNCLEIGENDINQIIASLLGEFPLSAIKIWLPDWVDALPMNNEIKESIFENLLEVCSDLHSVNDLAKAVELIKTNESISSIHIEKTEMATGEVSLSLEFDKIIYYEILSKQSGFNIKNDCDVMNILTQIKSMKNDYDRISDALESVRKTGYGVVLPTQDELHLDNPRIVRRGGKYSVKLKATAPAIHMLKTCIETEVSPILDGTNGSDEIMAFLLQSYDGDVSQLWQSNIFGKSLYEIADEGLVEKIESLPENTKGKLQTTLQKVINEGSGGIICIII